MNQTAETTNGLLCLLFIHPPAHGSEVSPAARNTLDSARIPRASKLLICGLFLKGRVLAQDGVPMSQPYIMAASSLRLQELLWQKAVELR